MFVLVVLPPSVFPPGGVCPLSITRGPPPTGVCGPASPRRGAADVPALLIGEGDSARFWNIDPSVLTVELLDGPDRAPLDQGRVDLILVVPPDFRARLEANQSPELTL